MTYFYICYKVPTAYSFLNNFIVSTTYLLLLIGEKFLQETD